jgi:hypothetical protein
MDVKLSLTVREEHRLQIKAMGTVFRPGKCKKGGEKCIR